MRVRRFNADGVVAFRQELDRLRSDRAADPTRLLLVDAALTEELPGGGEIELRELTTKRAAAEYLATALDGTGAPRDLLADAGLWAWLSLFHFDSVCPAVDGGRKVRVDANYIPDLAFAFRRYRHLLRTPYLVYIEVPPPNRILLDGPLSTQGDVVEQMMGRLAIMRVSTLRKAIDLLYFDEQRGVVKRGAVSGRSPAAGDLRYRFPARLRQLSLVYDVESLTVESLLELLGPEFASWRTR